MLQPQLRPLATALLRRTTLQFVAAHHYSTANAPTPAPAQPTAATAGLAASLKEPEDLSKIIRTYTPRTPGVRHLKRPINTHLWKGRPWLSLTIPKKGQARGGRNNTGRITVRHRGGGHKRRIRTVDFHRREPGPQLVERIEYDPGRSAHIALLTHKATGKKSYIIASDGLRAGDVVQSYRAGLPAELVEEMGGIIDPGVLAAKTAHPGNCLPLHMIPVGTVIFCIGSHRDGGAVFCRSAGTYGLLAAKQEETGPDGQKMVVGRHVQVRLQSGEVRNVDKNAVATIGQASNTYYNYRSLGKAGRKRWLGIRPTVRGVAMNTGMFLALLGLFGRTLADGIMNNYSRPSSRRWSW